MSTLDRLRGIVQGTRPSAIPVVSPELERSESDGFSHRLPRPATAEAVALRTSLAASTLGGTIVERAEGAVILVDREYRADDLHGRRRIGDIVETIEEGRDALATMARAWPSATGVGGTLLFLDLETTGLFTGAGTQAFLVGCAGSFKARARRQSLLSRQS